MGGLDEEGAEILIATLGDPAKLGTIAGRLLFGHEAEPGGEVASLLEAAAGTGGCHYGARDDRADTRHGHQTLAGGIVLREGLDLLVALEERLDVLRRDQADVMTEWLDFAGYVMRARAGLQANEAGRQIDKPADKLASRYLEAGDDRAALVEADKVERGLTNVEADCGYWIG